MTAASAALAYEQAAALRDKLKALQWLHDHLQRLRDARQQGSFIYPVLGHDGRHLWYLIHGGSAVTALPAPGDRAGWHRAAEAIQSVFQRGRFPAGGEPAAVAEEVLLVAGWFRRHPAERARTLEPAAVLAACEREGS
jgi:excinuclease ABC subunit C